MTHSTAYSAVSGRNKFSSGFKFLGILLLVLLLSGKSWGQYSITAIGSGNTYTQNFNAFAGTLATLPANWTWSWTDYTPGAYYNRTGTYSSSNSTYGLRESASPGTDIAFGGKIDGSTYYLAFSATNNTGSAINGFTITWNVEQYSASSNPTPVDFTYRLNAGTYVVTGVTGTTLTTASTLSTAANLSSITTTTRSITITGINLANSGTVDFRLSIGNGTANNAHIGVDDFTMYATAAPTNSSASDIIRNATFTEPTNIAYGSFQATDIINDGNSLEIAKFDIRDGGATTDGDALGTDLTAISFSLSNWANVRRLALYDGTTEISEVAVSSGTVAFTGLTGLTTTDGTSKTLTVRASFNSAVTDNQQLQLTVTSATANATGSTFVAAAAGGAASSITGSSNKIIVNATKLLFVQQPTGAAVDVAMSPNPTVKACDANNNTDIDFSTAVSVTSTGTLTGAPVSGTWSNGIATFSSLTHTVIGSSLTLTASSAGITDATSNAFDIASACVTTPTITTTITPNTIATTTANSGGQSLSVDAGCSVDSKGVCWGTSTAPTITGSKTSDGTGTSNFTSNITGLTSGTLYYVRAYATNSIGTSYGDEKTFRTLSLEPTAQPAAFSTSTVSSSSTLDLTFSAASTITNGAGYIILQRSGAVAPTGVPTDGIGYTVGATIGDATVAAIISNSATTTVSISGLSGNSQYTFSLIALNWDGANAATYNYKTSATIKTTSATTLKIEPTNQATSLAVGAVTTANIPLTWTAAVTGSQAPDGYLIKLNTSSVVDPVDGTSPADALNVSGGSGNKLTSSLAYSSFTTWTAGTMYNFKVYSYSNSGTNINFNLISPASINHATLPAVVTSTSLVASSTTTANITWTLPASYNSGNHSTLVFVKATSGVITGTPTNVPSGYTANTTLGSGTAFQNDASATCVYNGDGTSVSITGLSAGTTYYALIYTVVDASNSNSTNSYSATATPNGATPKIEPTNQATAFAVGNVTTSAIPLTWTAATTGSQAPDGYLVKLNTSSVVDPVDGTDPANITAITSGAANKTATGTSATTFTSMTAGTMYNYKIYSYTNSGSNINFNLTSAPSLNHATLPNPVTAGAFTANGTSTATITWTAASGYNNTNHSTLVFLKPTASITAGTPTNAPSAYTANSTFGSGTAYQNDASAFCVYNGDGVSIAVSGLSAGTTYQVLIYTVVDASNSNSTNSYSASSTVSGATLTVAVTVPYSQDFEGTTSEWSFGTLSTNKWAIGTGTNNGGTKGMYISSDAGVTNAYDIATSQTGTDASLRVDLTGLTAASLSFDWKSNGEVVGNTVYDYGEVYINTGASDVLISSAKEFVNTTTFANRRISLTAYVGSIVSLKFRWINDGLDGNQPPFAVDNISITAGDAPVVTTTAASSITINGASTGGNVTNDGGATATRGVCYGSTTNPTISGSHTTDGTGTGLYTSTLTGLTDNTLYYARAYATNTTGTSYGNEVSFTTPSVASPTVSTDNLTSSGFTANWGAITGAASYRLELSTYSAFSIGSSGTITEEFNSSTTAPTNWTFTSIGGTYTSAGNYGAASPSLKLDATNDRVQTATTGGQATQMSFWIKGQGTNAASAFLVEGYNGSSWVTIQNISNSIPVTGTTYTYNSGSTPALPTGIVQFRFTFTQSTGNLSFDDVSIDYSATPSFVAGYDGTETITATTKSISGLTPNTTYYCRVRSLSGNSTSGNSTPVSVTTLATYTIAASSNNETKGTVSSAGGTYDAGTAISLTATPTSGSYRFVNWTDGGGTFVSKANPYEFTASANKTLVANFADLTAPINITTPTNASTFTACPTCDLTVASGGSLTIDEAKTFNSVTVVPGGKLSLANGSTLTAPVTLQSSPSGTATFVDSNTATNPTAVTGTVEQYLTSGRNWYVSIPLTSADSTALSTAISRKYWNEPTGTWLSPSALALNTQRGYISVGTNSSSAISMNGTFTSGPQTYALTRTAGVTKEGFNLIGNPYPSYVNWDLVEKTNVETTIWYRTKSATAYVFDTYNASGQTGTGNNGVTVNSNIPPMQAFWVRVLPAGGASTTGSLTFRNSMRTHKGSQTANSVTTPDVNLKAPTTTKYVQQLLRLQVSNGTNTDEAIMLFNPNALNGLDSYDSPKMTNANVAIPEIYTLAGNNELVINGMNSYTLNTEIPLGFRPGQITNFSIKATQFVNFDSGVRVFIKDANNTSETDITETGYTFSTTDATPTVSRFSVIFKSNSVTTGFGNNEENLNVAISKNANNQIVVNYNGILNNESTVAVYNALGQKVASKGISSSSTVISIPNGLGVYVVTVNTGGKIATKKVTIN